jgi:hypothetical protein
MPMVLTYSKTCGLKLLCQMSSTIHSNLRPRYLFPVSYVRERIKLEANWQIDMRDPKTQEAIFQMMSSKGEDWIYEQELRQFFRLSKLKKKRLKGKTVRYFQPISSNAIVSVSLGVRCSKNLENKVRSLLSNSHFSHVKLDRAGLHKTDFALKFE